MSHTKNIVIVAKSFGNGDGRAETGLDFRIDLLCLVVSIGVFLLRLLPLLLPVLKPLFQCDAADPLEMKRKTVSTTYSSTIIRL